MKCILFFLLFCFTGCMMVRYTAIPKVDGGDVSFNTKYRYRMVGYKVGANWQAFDQVKQTMEHEYPGVFSDDGIPFVLLETEIRSEQNYIWTFALYGFSAFTFPGIQEDIEDYKYAVKIGDDLFAEYDMRYEKGSSITLFSPLGALFWHGKPDMGEYKGFYGSFFNEKVDADNKYAINRSAIAYGAAIKLRELELSGKIDPEKLKRKPLPVVQPSQSKAVQRQNIVSDKKPIDIPVPAKSRSVQVYEVENLTFQ